MKYRLLVFLALASPAALFAQSLVGIPHGPNDPGNCGYTSSAGCADKATFNTSSFDSSLGRWIYYAAQNSRILVNVKTTTGWLWPTSKVAVDMASTDPGATVALGTVLAISGANPSYLRPVNGQPASSWQRYRRVMYFVFQGAGDPTAGRICLSYSNSTTDANDWTPPIAAVFSTTGTPRGRPCNVANAEVHVEAVSAFHRTGTEINLFALHGDLPVLQAAVTSNPTGGLTETYFLKTTTDTPDVIQVQAMVTSNGMFTPTITGGDHDYFFRNLDATFDPVTSRVYLLRVTPFPFDVSRSADIPCATSACPGGLGTFPMRGQIYYMNVQGDVAKTTLPTSSWTLLADYGSKQGWDIGTTTCQPFLADVAGQQNIALDLDSITLHKMPNGRVSTASGFLELYMGAWGPVRRTLSCHIPVNPDNPGGTWVDAELYSMSILAPP